MLEALQRNGHGKIKVLITSRPNAEIRDGLHSFSTLAISKTSNSADIKTYLNAELDRKSCFNRRWGKKLAEPVDLDELREEVQANSDYGKNVIKLVEHATESLTWKFVIVSFLIWRAGGM